jgi:lysine/ornithine N-monooxygenase
MEKQRGFEAVILATGYRPRVNAFLEGAPAAYGDNGTPYLFTALSGC